MASDRATELADHKRRVLSQVLQAGQPQRNKVEVGLVAGLLRMDPDGPLHHSIFPHQHDRVSTKSLPNILQLVRSDIVGRGDEDLGVLIKKLAQLLIISDLLFGLRCFHRH
ncbi:unnamed protein product [Ilex paraguariensis]|uniref:Uncharacterized protein n=1 Tax=Ilex paraguariensis TaxID=185542 RepID=A0ABC8UE89_9AQUA